MVINSVDSFLNNMAVPKTCVLNKPVFKKMFLETGVLDATDKLCLKDDVEKVRWLYTLKPSTINIAAYKDEEREYPEIAILLIELSSSSRIKRIANFIHRSIPYPLVLSFTGNVDGASHIAISLADKRINQADKEKWVIEGCIQTHWINLSEQTRPESDFMASFVINALSFKNFWEFYKGLTARVIAIICAIHSGEFTLGENKSIKNESGNDGFDNRLVMLRDIERLNAKKSEITNKLKKEKQMGRQVDLNTQVKKINDEIALIKGNL
jgi:hypothetical protein